MQKHKVAKELIERYLIWVIFSNHRSNCTPKWPSKDNYSSCVNVSPLRKMIQCSLTEEKLTVNKQHHNIKSRFQSSLNRKIYLSIFSNSMLRRKSVTCSITVYVIEHWHLKTISTNTSLLFIFYWPNEATDKITKRLDINIAGTYPRYESINTLHCNFCNIMRTISRRCAISAGN